ncbi:GNAT family N-acetyltransferase [Deinococcus humi]|uniref:Ribosomal protein S18 acetylase RimI-like enzyme n=1 Tax=Deinococcus humi TaxID=662880 RepID=A0A7W8ND34_9DEIO|nr:GNAT family N-acetyltransferase [Deinococcus humi]MBB5361200.1 ribosomal protein S18 acetylase RimI-like enzyme [Deinococcus humi]GGO18888.1 N-acetyltransferase [Deinococcus humi]
MASEPQVRKLGEGDTALYREVRLAALLNDPDAFITTAAEFQARTPESVAAQLRPRPTLVNFGAFVDGALMGLLSLAREERPRLKHRASIFGVSVAPEARGQGCGDALLRAALAHVQTWEGVTSVHLSVTETQAAARRLYERHGFQVWGTQPDAVRDDQGRALIEHHLCLLLEDPSA